MRWKVFEKEKLYAFSVSILNIVVVKVVEIIPH